MPSERSCIGGCHASTKRRYFGAALAAATAAATPPPLLPTTPHSPRGRTLVVLKRQRLSSKGDGRTTATRRETSDAAEFAPPLGTTEPVPA